MEVETSPRRERVGERGIAVILKERRVRRWEVEEQCGWAAARSWQDRRRGKREVGAVVTK